MTRQSGPVYEVTFFMDTEIVGAFERWLEEWARDAARISGVDDCVCFAIANDERGLARRGCLYTFAGDDELNAFLDSADDDIETSIPPEFAGRVEVAARVLREDFREADPANMPDCLNCGARLHGQYCAVCGQRARSRLISLWELVTDAFGDLFEIDSRLWKTLTRCWSGRVDSPSTTCRDAARDTCRRSGCISFSACCSSSSPSSIRTGN